MPNPDDSPRPARPDTRVSLITGACGGIGQALCRRSLQRGQTVIALDRDADALASMTEQMRANAPVGCGERLHPLAADITDLEALVRAVAECARAVGPVDVLVANAAVAHGLTLKTATPDDWHRDVDVNLNGTYHCVEAVRASMMARGSGNIVIIGSVNALTALGHPAYSAAKAGLVSYTRSLALELGPYGIRCNIVLPGTVKTDAWQARVQKNPAVFTALKKWYPLGDFATPQDVAQAVDFLASRHARVITGVALPVDGGLMAGIRPLAAELTQEAF